MKLHALSLKYDTLYYSKEYCIYILYIEQTIASMHADARPSQMQWFLTKGILWVFCHRKVCVSEH